MFSCEFCEIFKNTFLQNTSRRQPQEIVEFYDISILPSDNDMFKVNN